MATRLYPTSTASAISPAVDSSWEVTDAGFARTALSITNTDHANLTNGASVGSGVANEDTVLRQLTYGPITGATITGTLKGQLTARESNAASDARIQLVARVISPGGTVRGTLIASDTAALSSEFLVDASAFRNIKAPRGGAVSVTSTAAQNGDYIVIEYGFRNHGTNTSAVRVATPGGDGSSGDLAENETTSPPTNFRAWFEFSQTLNPYVEATASAATGTGAANNATLTIAPTPTSATGTGTANDATISLLTPPRSITINGVAYTDKIRWDSFEFTEVANRGEVGIGKVLVDDAAGSLDIPAHRSFAFEEPAAGQANKYLYSGYTWDRTTQRGPGHVAGQREWLVEAVDLNTLADDYILTDAETADRPAETDYVRVAWLLTSRFNSVGGVGVGYVPNSNTVNLDAVDYRGRTPREVLNQCSEAAGKNWFLYNHDGTVDLFYDVTSGTNLSTSSRISDVLSDVDSSTTWAGTAASVHKSPDDIYSTVHFRWNEGTVTVTNATTASSYRTREISLTDTSVDSSTKATAKANAFLAAAAFEKISVDSITVKLPAANVNDFRAGQRCEIKLSRHGISSFTFYRILRRVVKPADDVSYYVTLTFTDQVLPTIFGSQRGGDVYGIWEKKSNATDDGATVIVDRAGINVIDGAITVVNSGATVIIDGESDMFRILDSGSFSQTGAASGASTTTTLTGLGALSATPVAILTIANSSSPTADQSVSLQTSHTLNNFTASTSGGAVTQDRVGTTWVRRSFIGLDGSSQAKVTINIFKDSTVGGSFDTYCYYYVLDQTAF